MAFEIFQSGPTGRQTSISIHYEVLLAVPYTPLPLDPFIFSRVYFFPCSDTLTAIPLLARCWHLLQWPLTVRQWHSVSLPTFHPVPSPRWHAYIHLACPHTLTSLLPVSAAALSFTWRFPQHETHAGTHAPARVSRPAGSALLVQSCVSSCPLVITLSLSVHWLPMIRAICLCLFLHAVTFPPSL